MQRRAGKLSITSLAWSLVICAAMLALNGEGGAATDERICEQANGKTSVAACTRLISSGRLSEIELTSVYLTRGILLRQSGDLDHAIVDFGKALEFAERNASRELTVSIYIVRGGAYSAKRDLNKALSDYQSAVKFDPSNQQARDGLSRTQAALAAGTASAKPSVRIEGNVPLSGAAKGGFQFYENRDLDGGDFRTIKDVDHEGCLAACQAQSGCQGYSFDKWNRWCFLKSAVTTLRLDPQSIAGIRSDLPRPALASIPEKIERYRNKTFPGAGYRSLASASTEACEKACDVDRTCVAYSFSKVARTCTLLDSAGEYFSDKTVDSGVKRQPAP